MCVVLIYVMLLVCLKCAYHVCGAYIFDSYAGQLRGFQTLLVLILPSFAPSPLEDLVEDHLLSLLF